VTIAGYMSTAYAIIMLAVTVGIVVQTSQDSWTSPNAMFIIVIMAIFILAGLLHPEEFMCLMPGVLYFLCIPSGELPSPTSLLLCGHTDVLADLYIMINDVREWQQSVVEKVLWTCVLQVQRKFRSDSVHVTPLETA